MRHILRWAVVVYLVVAGVASAQTLVVTESNLQGWTLSASAGTGDEPPPAAYLAAGYENPPAGAGSLHLNVGEDGNDAAQVRTNAFAGTRIADITALSYSTFTQVDLTGSAGDQAPYLMLHVDTDGNLATADVQLWFFEPAYQSMAPVMDTWQTWDAHAGGWYTGGGLAGSGPGANVKTFAELLAVAPNATIVSTGTGGVRIVTGFGAGAWDHYAGAADEFRFAAGATDVTYDFEPDATTFVTVTPSMLEEWTLTTVDEGVPGGTPSSTIVSGPGTPPLPPGSLRLAVGDDGADAAEARSDRWDGLYLRDLSALSYATFHESGGSGGQLPYLILRVDYDNDGGQDDLLFFEPAYQSAGFCGSNPQDEIASATWQSWEAANGCWWSLNTTAGAGAGVDVKPLATILAAQPDARLVTGASGGSFRVVAGFGAGAWDDFIGYVDELRVAIEPQADTTYDFDPEPTITITGDSTLEPDAGTTPLTFDVTLSHAVSYSITAQYATADGTATAADGDYASESGTVTFDPGETEAPITVDVNGDLKLEPDESFFVNLSSPSTGATLGNTQAEGLIGNDDAQPQIVISDRTLAEGDSGTTNFVFNVTLTNPSVQTITVDYATENDSATAPSDYASTSGTLTFDPGEVLQTVTVAVVGDTTFERVLPEGLNETFFVNLSDPVNATIADNRGLGTILGDDERPTVTISDVTEEEGDSDHGFGFVLTLSHPSAEATDINFQTFDGTAESDEDFSFENMLIRIEPGDTEETIFIGIFGDLFLEPDETFTVRIEGGDNVIVGDDTATGTILNDDEAPTVSVSNASVFEGSTPGENVLEFQVTLSHGREQPVTVTWSTADDTATAPGDYPASSGEVTIPASDDIFTNLTATITIPVNGDTNPELDETLFVNLTGATNATIDDGQGTGTIRNDDGALPQVFVNDVTLNEGDTGTTSFEFTVLLTRTNAEPVTVDFTTADDTAVAPGDYAPVSGTLTFAPGDTSETITVDVAGETLIEPDERFFLNLSNPDGATIGDSQAAGTIVNDDHPPVATIDDVSREEGDSGTTDFTFTVTLSKASDTEVTVDFATITNGAETPEDFASTSGTLTFAPGTTSQTITVTVTGDVVFENTESFMVNLSNPQGATLGDLQGVGTILNDDAPPTVSISDVTREEGGTFSFTLTKSGPTDLVVEVEYETADGTATSASDYTFETGTVFIFPSETTETITISVPDDSTPEDDENFFVNLTGATNGTIDDGQGEGTILDDDTPRVSISDAEELENGGSLLFDVTLTRLSATPVTVDFSTADGTATAPPDYVPLSGTITFEPNEFQKRIEVEILDDGEFEPDETLFVNLSNPDGVVIEDGQGIGLIRDDDGLPTISIDDVEQEEGDAGTTDFVFTVTLSHASSDPVTVDFETSDGTAAAPDDYLAASGTITIPAGSLTETITVQVAGETLTEADETFFVSLSNPTGATLAEIQGTGTIENDDIAVADLTVTKTGPASVDHGEPIDYVITVTNVGPEAATNVVVTDTIPSGTTFVSATPSQGNCSGTTTVTCTVGALENGASATINLRVTAPTVNGEISNTASADSDETDPTPAAGTASTFVVGAAANVAGIPTLSEWALLLMLMGLAGIAATKLKG
jgi:uncharacterized repeat protein (TIGR01451 family)